MAVEFSVLASGSRGNAAVVRDRTGGLLIDMGIGTRDLSRRMEDVGTTWSHLAAALLTHTHGDHICEANLNALVRHRIPLYCHEGHRRALARFRSLEVLERDRLLRFFDDRPFLTPDGKKVEAITLSHDGGPTFGFRVESAPRRKARRVAIGYVTDTGCWSHVIAEALTDVDLLGVEFNHDVQMQRESNRAPYLIARNLSNRGHLSNDQGASLIAEVLRRSSPRHLRHVVLLHLSEQCNRPDLALRAARETVRDAERRTRVYAAAQWVAHPHLPVAGLRGTARPIGAFPWETLATSPADESFTLSAE